MNHEQAKQLVDDTLFELTPAESLVLRAVALHETGYGEGWKGGPGEGSHNMGAITKAPGPDGECGSDGFPHGDSRFDATAGKVVKYTTCFRRYPDAAAGMSDLARTLLKPNVKRAAPGGVYDVAEAMRKNRYFLGTAPTRAEQVNEYASALDRAVKSIREATKEPDPFVYTATGGPRLQPSALPASRGSSGRLPPQGSPGGARQPTPAELLGELGKVANAFERGATALEGATDALERATDAATELVDTLCHAATGRESTVPPGRDPLDTRDERETT